MFRIGRIAVLLVCAASLSAAQSNPPASAPEELSVCDLIQNAPSYDGHLVRVRGEIVFEFENFVISSGPGCEIGTSHERNPVWLTYGGDETDPAVYCCGSHAKTKGKDLEIEGHRLPLVRDGAYRELRDRLEAKRLRRPDGSICYDECKFYRVTATIAGTFFAAKTDPGTFSGYGHLGCCNLLVIQQVSEVSAERTDVPVGGEFQCNSDTWTPDEGAAHQLRILRHCDPSLDANCDSYDEIALIQVAKHWKENLDLRRSGFRSSYVDINGSLVTDWLSSDLLTHYVARSQSTRESGSLEKASITRTICSAAVDRSPKQDADIVSCSERSLGDWDDPVFFKKRLALIERGDYSHVTQMDYERARHLFSTGDQSWRFFSEKDAASYLLTQQAKKWKIDVAQLTFDKCDDDSGDLVGRGQVASCSWFTKDGLEALDVSLLRHTAEFSTDDRKIPWVATWVHAHICQIHESQASEDAVPLR